MNLDYPYDADPTDHDYIHPTDRPTEWARMATDYAHAGRTLPDIAALLCISEDTAAALLQEGPAS
ncbi:hypothetical protein [Streptomyces sp. NPDC058872]|uniref:hypothetical protein n=1 Tax=Streptomyces sp. NPDC058872 TaxID=3346661 RepID=UPI00367CEB12